ncbi:glycosyltransferase [Bordetella sp. 15P40C-2]|uniref:glycosyltransferase n=1 Tax=Bordetella sp. 15P40C-2 TaxID=2572246 RepID=UPI0013223CB0|nr:glycosyltransferase [Bordetella sp. 15P40C-2]MVW71375.1 glycosyltransferase [Bordetella sp. 15P40C-2]
MCTAATNAGGSATAFSLLMAVYAGDRACDLIAALNSVARSSLLPDQIVLVQDGPVGPGLIAAISQFQHTLNIERVVLPENRGLGPALQTGLLRCTNALVARFDSDDILVPSRFHDQVSYFKAHPTTSVLGGWIAEFDSNPDDILTIRQVPLTTAAIVKYAKKRNPMNHMTVMFRKEDVLASGGYRDDPGFEDYSLWARMLQKGFVFANVSKVTVLARTGTSMIRRRGGWRYVRLEFLLQATLYRAGIVGPIGVLRNLMLRIPARLVPAKVRSFIYKHALRRKIESLHE